MRRNRKPFYGFISHSLLQIAKRRCYRRIRVTRIIGVWHSAEDCATCGREAVKSLLRLFDELVKCDEEGMLKDVRDAVEGK